MSDGDHPRETEVRDGGVVPEDFDLDAARYGRSTTDTTDRPKCPHCDSLQIVQKAGLPEDRENPEPWYCKGCNTHVDEPTNPPARDGLVTDGAGYVLIIRGSTKEGVYHLPGDDDGDTPRCVDDDDRPYRRMPRPTVPEHYHCCAFCDPEEDTTHSEVDLSYQRALENADPDDLATDGGTRGQAYAGPVLVGLVVLAFLTLVLLAWYGGLL